MHGIGSLVRAENVCPSHLQVGREAKKQQEAAEALARRQRAEQRLAADSELRRKKPVMTRSFLAQRKQAGGSSHPRNAHVDLELQADLQRGAVHDL